MSALDFVFLREDTSLRRMVDLVREAAATREMDWYLFCVLVQSGDGYCCTRLNQLSAELENVWRTSGSGWSLSMSITDLHLDPCFLMPSGRMSAAAWREVRQPYVVVEEAGEPVTLYRAQTARRIARTSPVGWWWLVGQRTAELGEFPEWPDPLPETIQCETVSWIQPQTSLAELAAQVEHLPRGEDSVIAISLGDGRWSIDSPRKVLARILSDYADASPSSEVGAFVEPDPFVGGLLERAEAPWELVQALLASSDSRPLLITAGGRPAHMLSSQDMMPRGTVQESEASWSRFLASASSLKPEAKDRGRVVNAWFASADGLDIPYTHALEANCAYLLTVNVGARSAQAHVVGAQPSLDAKVVNYVANRDQDLIVRLESEDLILPVRERQLDFLAAGTSADCSFEVITPIQTGISLLRLGIFMANNLLQSYRIYVRVAPREGAMPEGAGDGWWSECEYTLSSDLTNLGDLDSRRVCLWIGAGQKETWCVGLGESTGLSVGPPISIHSRLVEEALQNYRELLTENCIQEREGRSEYLYRADHAPYEATLFDDGIKDLAELGQMLYDRAFGTESGLRVAERLKAIEQTQTAGPLVVQIARLSLDATFPWAALYDRPLRYHPGRNIVCRRFLDDPRCSSRCPYGTDLNVICPYGFWGFRYILEQPLRPPGAFSSVVTRIPTADRPRIALVYGTELGMTDYHRQRIDAIARARADCVVHSTTADLLAEMAAGPAVVYLYCHGGNTRYRQWLVVGDDDPLMPTHLGDELRSKWSCQRDHGSSGPLVVLNGCHTGRYDPATLLSFVHRFGALGAAGVVGTEIPIHEYLGRAFGEFFMGRLLNGEPVGQIIYDFRCELLKRQNLLGLAYVAYCYASLCLVAREKR